MSSFSEGQSFFTLRRILIGLGVFSLVVLFVIGGPIVLRDLGKSLENSPLIPKSAPDRIIAELGRDPQVRSMMTAFRTHFPADYQRFVQRVSAAYDDAGNRGASEEAFIFMEDFMRSKVQLVASAPSQDLQRLAAGVAELYGVLRRRDVDFCANFFMGGPTVDDRMPSEAQPLMAQLNVLQITSARKAQDGTGMARGRLSERDRHAWMARMSAIDPKSGDLLGSRRLARATPAEQCDAGFAMFRAIADLPVDQSANVMATVLIQTAAASR